LDAGRIAVLSDLHVPFHDEEALEAALRFLGRFRPHVLGILGDAVDFYQLSRFDRDPARRFQLAEDVRLAGRVIRRIVEAAGEPKVRFWVDGNHEDRLRRFIWARAPELHDWPGLSVHTVLGLEELGFEVVPYYDPVNQTGRPGYILNGWIFTHGIFTRKGGGNTARAHLEHFMASGVCGHSHRLATHRRRAWGRPELVWHEAGCLCRLEPAYSLSPDWQHGFLAGTILGETDVRLEEVPIVGGRAVFRGELY
jgi:predicted phosphodiesterase